MMYDWLMSDACSDLRSGCVNKLWWHCAFFSLSLWFTNKIPYIIINSHINFSKHKSRETDGGTSVLDHFPQVYNIVGQFNGDGLVMQKAKQTVVQPRLFESQVLMGGSADLVIQIESNKIIIEPRCRRVKKRWT